MIGQAANQKSRNSGGVTRRGFLKQASVTAGLALPAIVPSSVFGANAPSNRVNLAAFGVGGRGTWVNTTFSQFPDARYVAVCDAYESRRLEKKKVWDELYGGDYVKTYDNPWEVLERDDVDAVVIATPDHWHVPLAIAAARAGKDMYVEKPLSVAMKWSWKLREEFKNRDLVFQYGTQQRSFQQFRYACELVRNGHIGEVKRIEAWCPEMSQQYAAFEVRKYGSVRSVPPPADLNFDLWTGPAPKRDYTVDRCTCFGTYHIYDYALGFVAGWGAHPLDIAQWGMDADDSGPVYYEGSGGLPERGLMDTVDWWDVTCHYGNGALMRFMSERISKDVIMEYRGRYSDHGTTFFGTEGWISVDRRSVEASSPSLEQVEFGPNDHRLYKSDDHWRNFLDCVKSRKPAICTLESAIRSDTISHLSDIMIRTGRPIEWDPKREEIVGDPAASKILDRPMRKDWAV